jgi:hypothetical protein
MEENVFVITLEASGTVTPAQPDADNTQPETEEVEQ